MTREKSKEHAVKHQEEQQSLDQMLATIGSYLPKRLFGQPPEPSDWKLSHRGTVSPLHVLTKKPVTK